MHLQPGSLAVHLILRSVQRTTSNAYSGLGSTSCLRMAIQPASCWRSRPTSTTSTRGILDALDIVSDEETLSSSSCGDESGRTKSKLHARAQARRDGAMEAARSAIRTAAVEVAANTASTNRMITRVQRATPFGHNYWRSITTVLTHCHTTTVCSSDAVDWADRRSSFFSVRAAQSMEPRPFEPYHGPEVGVTWACAVLLILSRRANRA
jgi:hypothetical protein